MAELFKAISNHEILSFWVAIFFSLFMIFFPKYPEYRHKRYLNNILLIAFSLCVIWTIQVLEFLSISVAIFLYILCGAYLFISYYTAKKVIYPESSPLFLLEKFIREGDYHNIDKRVPKKPFYVQSITGRIKWNLLWGKKLINQGQPRQAYETYSKLLTLPLFEEEQSDIRLKQVQTLLLLGDTNKAKTIYERTENKTGQHKYYESLYLQSQFYERCGEIEKARQSLLSAVGEHDSIQTIELGMIYNDLGRMEKILNNMANVIHYYRKAAEIACYHNDKNIIHIVYPNIIDIYLLTGDNENAVSFFNKYSELIDNNNIDDLMKFNNYSLEYARQTENSSFYIKILEQGRIEILSKLSERERLSFEVSELRIRWNSQYRWEEQLVLVSGYLPEYLKLEFPYRFNLIKEIYTVLCMFAENHKLGPFEGLFSQLLKIMWQSKKDIERYIIDLPDYCVFERCSWEEEMVSLRRFQQKDKLQTPFAIYCVEKLEYLQNIKDIQLQHGNILAAIKADLNIADECMGLAQATRDATTINDLKNTLRQHLDSGCRDLEKFRWHPVSPEYVLRIAMYALFLDDRERGRKYFDDFIKSKISIHHYSIWLQRYYHDLCQAFR